MSVKGIPPEPHFYREKLGFAGVYLFFLILAPKHRMWVLVRTALFVVNNAQRKFRHANMLSQLTQFL